MKTKPVLYTVGSRVKGELVYLTQYTGKSLLDVAHQVLREYQQNENPNYQGSAGDRMAELGWWAVPLYDERPGPVGKMRLLTFNIQHGPSTEERHACMRQGRAVMETTSRIEALATRLPNLAEALARVWNYSQVFGRKYRHSYVAYNLVSAVEIDDIPDDLAVNICHHPLVENLPQSVEDFA